MLEIFEKTMLAGIGALSLTQKKSEELLDEMKERLNMTEEEGKNFLDKLQDAAKENQNKLEEIAREEVQKACERTGIVTAEEFEKLNKKVTQLEKQVKALQA